jgi:hypothetical protein
MGKPHFIPDPCTKGFGPPTEGPPRCIDVDAGYSIKELPDGTRIFMHKAHPGTYLNASGEEISEAIAKQAGFDTERYRRERTRSDKMAEAQAVIEQELTAHQATPEASVVAERNGYRLLDVGYSRFQVTLDDGTPVTPKAVTLPLARSIFAKLAPETVSASSGV